MKILIVGLCILFLTACGGPTWKKAEKGARHVVWSIPF